MGTGTCQNLRGRRAHLASPAQPAPAPPPREFAVQAPQKGVSQSSHMMPGQQQQQRPREAHLKQLAFSGQPQNTYNGTCLKEQAF